MKKILIIITIAIFIFSSFSLVTSSLEIKSFIDPKEGDGVTEYWAIIIGLDHTQSWGNVFGLPIDRNVNSMYKTLLVSDHWKSDHIRLIKNENATRIKIINAFRWLDRMEDGDDVCLVYYIGHGGHLFWNFEKLGLKIPIDLPPFDEKDRCDEFITTYPLIGTSSGMITDDLLNRLLNRLDSKGIAVIIDSCYSGGMSDAVNKKGIFRRVFENNFSDWLKDFSDDISNKGIVTLAACKENESAISIDKMFGGGFVSEGLQGYADKNKDGRVSAEEAFDYAAPLYHNHWIVGGEVTPTIDDMYPGELLLTDVDLPPSKPVLTTNNNKVGQTDFIFKFNASSIDPESDNIRYAWDFRNDSIINFEKDYVQLWTDYFKSGEVCSMNYSWSKPGVYIIRAKSQDEHGAEIIPDEEYTNLWAKSLYILIPTENEKVDQYQIETEFRSYNSNGIAQSFKPKGSSLSKIKLKLNLPTGYNSYLEIFKKYPLNVSIRNDLNGTDLVKVSKKPYIDMKEDISYWIEFDFPDLKVIPGEKYFIVVKFLNYTFEDDFYGISGTEEIEDVYPLGKSYFLDNEGMWRIDGSSDSYLDYCFITYE